MSNGGAGEQHPLGKAWFGLWVIAPPACCLVRSSRRLAGAQAAPPLLWMRSVQSNDRLHRQVYLVRWLGLSALMLGFIL